MSSAYSITQAVNPPRAAYLDYPLGHTTGKPLDADNQLAIMRAAMDAFTVLQNPGEILQMPFEWQADHSWKDRVMRPRTTTHKSDSDSSDHSDDRVSRHPTPQYQSQADADAVEGECPSCVFLNETI